MILPKVALLLLGAVAAEDSMRSARFSARDEKQQAGFPVKVTNLFFDGGYSLPISIGTPPRTVHTLLSSSGYIALVDKGGFVANKSKTFDLETTYEMNSPALPKPAPLGMPVGWRFGRDIISVGNESTELGFWSTSWPLMNDPVFGIGLPTRPASKPSFWDMTMANWAEKQIGLFFSRHRAEWQPTSRDTFEDSEIMVGGLNTAKFIGDMVYHPFTPEPNENAWVVPLEGISINGNAVDLWGTANNVTVAANDTTTGAATPTGFPDSSPSTGPGADGQNMALRAYINVGTPVSRFPPQVVSSIVKNIPDAQHLEHAEPWVPCNATIANLSFRLTIGNEQYSINAQDIVGQPVPDTVWTGRGLPEPAVPYCQTYIETSKNSSAPPVLGTMFLKNVYTALRFDPPAVGFAQLSETAQPYSWAAPLASGYPTVVAIGAAAAAIACC